MLVDMYWVGGGEEVYFAMCDSGCCEIRLAIEGGIAQEWLVPVFFLPKHCTLCVVAMFAIDNSVIGRRYGSSKCSIFLASVGGASISLSLFIGLRPNSLYVYALN